MDNDQDLELAYQLQLEDIDDLEESQRGNQATEALTDANIALQLMRDDLLEAQTGLQAHNAVAANDADQTSPAAQTGLEARNTAAANDADHDLLANTERTAEQDHVFALQLENLARANEFNAEVNEHGPEDEGLAVIRGLLDLLRNHDGLLDGDLPGENESTNGEDPSGPADPIQEPEFDCVGCLEMRAGVVFHGDCGHQFCGECTRRLFLNAIRDEQNFPPQCCGEDAPLELALEVLNEQEIQQFRDRAFEWVAEERVYCADPICSKFIPDSARVNGHGICIQCGKQTHIACRSLAHPGTDCPVDDEMSRFLEMAGDQGWRQCSRCRGMVERNQGCNHIVCRCANEFCYVCGTPWGNCDCPMYQQDDLAARQNVAVEVAPPAPPAAPAPAANGAQHHEEVPCRHWGAAQWVWVDRGNLRCELCHEEMRVYLFMCRNCRMRVCDPCRLRFRD